MEEKMNELRKRTRSDMVCSILVAVVALAKAVTEFHACGSAGTELVKHLTNGIYAVFVLGVAIILSMMLLEVHKIGKPFSRKIIWELRILAVFVIVGGFLPDTVIPMIVNTLHGTSELIGIDVVLSAKNVVVSVIGVVIGIVSEIFVYGYELQDDMDSIA